MWLVTAEEMRAADRHAIDDVGIPGLILMEQAGRRLALEAAGLGGCGSRVVCVVGRGNNGGDGLVAARWLWLKEHPVTVVLTDRPLSPDAAANLRSVQGLGIPVLELTGDEERVKLELSVAGVIVDAVLGTGVRGQIRGVAATAVNLINGAGRPVISADIPSGLNADTGQAKLCVQADMTVTFGFIKRGLVLYPGAMLAGRVVVADIGLPASALTRAQAVLMDDDLAREWLPARPPDVHKGTCGRVLILAGSPGYSGAAVLAARSTLRVGAGLCFLAAPVGICQVLEASLPEVITVALPETAQGMVSVNAVARVQEVAAECDAVAVGPGLGRCLETAELVRRVADTVTCPLIIDADGLAPWEGMVSDLARLKAPVIITPHPGEMARLIDTSVSDVLADVIGVASAVAADAAGVCLLKGPATVVADDRGFVAVSASGNSGMASAGMGDVLTGVIAGLAAGGVMPARAAALGAYVHGVAGRYAAEKGQLGLMAGDVAGELPRAIQSLERGRRRK